MTNKQIAIDHIKPYVLEHKETVADLRKGQMGHYCEDFNVYIKGNKIIVEQDGQEEVFSLKKIFDLIK